MLEWQPGYFRIQGSSTWDGGGLPMRAFQTVLGLPGDAWDVFMVYRPQTNWDGDLPPQPDYWMH
jgi:hypothetical protein